MGNFEMVVLLVRKFVWKVVFRGKVVLYGLGFFF